MRYNLIKEYPFIKIYINDILHLKFKEREFLGIQSWKEGKELFCIEYYFQNDQVILSEYDEMEKWIEILKLIEKEL